MDNRERASARDETKKTNFGGGETLKFYSAMRKWAAVKKKKKQTETQATFPP